MEGGGKKVEGKKWMGCGKKWVGNNFTLSPQTTDKVLIEPRKKNQEKKPEVSKWIIYVFRDIE